MAGVGAVCAAVLAIRQRRDPAPLLALDLFRNPMFALSAAVAEIAFTVQGAVFLALPFWLQGFLRYDRMLTGYVMTAWPICATGMALVASRLAQRRSVALLGSASFLMLATALAALTLTAGGSLRTTGLLALCGLGFGLFQAPNMGAIMASAPLVRSGGASGVLALARLSGQTLGATLLASCLVVAPACGSRSCLQLAAGLALLARCCQLLAKRAADLEDRVAPLPVVDVAPNFGPSHRRAFVADSHASSSLVGSAAAGCFWLARGVRCRV